MISHFFTPPSVSFLLPHLHPDLLIRASVEDAAVHGTVPYVPAHGDADVLFPGAGWRCRRPGSGCFSSSSSAGMPMISPLLNIVLDIRA